MPVTYNCLIVDDEPLARELLLEHVSKIPELKVLACCSNALEASSQMAKERVDLLFLDINMPMIKGIQFFKSLVNKPKVIFTTAHREYALEGFEVSALDYLLKPIIFDRFFLGVQKFFDTMDKAGPVLTEMYLPGREERRETIFVNQGHRKVKVELKTVQYIESFRDYIVIHGADGRAVRVKENIGTFEKKLDKHFIRVHRSYIVNKEHVTGYTKLDVELNEKELPIGASYREKVLAFFEA